MRFITEFQFDEGSTPTEMTIKFRKEMRDDQLGQMIRASFAYQNPVNGNPLHHRLEIEAFPMDKWIEFKRDLFAFLDLDSLQYKTLLDRVLDLESFGKPAGAAKEL